MNKKLTIGATYINVFSQEVEITDINAKDNCVVFEDINNDSVDTLRIEEFNKIFKKIEKENDN